jgi:hypothetical protein
MKRKWNSDLLGLSGLSAIYLITICSRHINAFISVTNSWSLTTWFGANGRSGTHIQRHNTNKLQCASAQYILINYSSPAPWCVSYFCLFQSFSKDEDVTCCHGKYSLCQGVPDPPFLCLHVGASCLPIYSSQGRQNSFPTSRHLLISCASCGLPSH